MIAVFFTLRHAPACKLAAVALAVGVLEAVSVHGEDAAVVGRDLARRFPFRAIGRSHFQPQKLRVPADGQHAAIAVAGDAHEHNAVFRIDGQHLIALLRLDARARVVEARLVDADMLPAAVQRLGVLVQIALERRVIQHRERHLEVCLRVILDGLGRFCISRRFLRLYRLEFCLYGFRCRFRLRLHRRTCKRAGRQNKT